MATGKQKKRQKNRRFENRKDNAAKAVFDHKVTLADESLRGPHRDLWGTKRTY